MIRRVMAFVFALSVCPALVYAQDTVFTVTAPTADVYKGPSTINPVVGHVSRGTVLPVSRNLGSWVKVPWPDAPEGIGYVHVTMGRIGPPSGDEPMPNGARTPSTPASAATASQRGIAPREPMAPRSAVNVTPASHVFGVGGLVAPMTTFGASARAWRNNRLGVQFAFTRDTMTSNVADSRLTATEFEPGVVYGLFDRVSDYIWIRPYVGSTLNFRRQTLSVPGSAATASDSGIGFRVFGGSELTFAAMPQFGLSVDVGYRRIPNPIAGFEVRPVTVSIAGHWYVK